MATTGFIVKNGKEWLANGMVMLASVLIVTLCAEFAVRQWAPQVTLFPRYVESNEYPMAFPPNSKLVHSQGRFWRFVYTTNSLGHRGSDISIPDSDRRPRVLTLGDSFTFGMGVNDRDVYVDRLASRLGPSFNVINGGMAGWGLDAEIKWYFATGVHYRPDIVTLQFSANDPADSSTNPVTRIEGNEFRFYRYKVRKSPLQKFVSESFLLQNSHLYSLLRMALSRLHTTGRSNGDVQAGATQSNASELRYTAMLRLFAESLKGQGVPLLFISVTHEHVGAGYHYDLDDFPAIGAAVRELEASGDVAFVHLPLHEMQRHPRNPEPHHQWSNVHHALVGDALALAIRRATLCSRQ